MHVFRALYELETVLESGVQTMSHNGIDLALINDRRQCIDRRERVVKSEFPLVDSDGRFIKVDRRHVPDRRLANIQVKEVSVNGQIFSSLFSNN